MQEPRRSLGILPKMEEELMGGGMGTKTDRYVVLKRAMSVTQPVDMPCILALLYVQNFHGK